MAELLQYKCPRCGGAIEFDTSVQKVKCPYCDTEFDMETLKSLDKGLEKDNMEWESKAGQEWQPEETENLSVYSCKSCGGEIVADATTVATSCPYCGNPVVMTGKLSGALKPDYVIPFKIDKNGAKQGLMNHYKGKRLLPDLFKDQNHVDEIKGVYVPFWLFDTAADADIEYRATTVRTWSDSDYRYTETKYYSALRSGNIGFEKVPVDGDSKIDNVLMESIEPFDFSEAVDFQTAYLAGFFADKYDVDADMSVERANERIKKSTESVFSSTVTGYDSVTTEKSSVRFSNSSTKYALYPVWLLSTSWKGKQYVFAMNGQTGKFVGDLPVDKGKFWKYFAMFAGIFSAASFLLMTIASFL